MTIALATYGRIGAESHLGIEVLVAQAGGSLLDAWAAPRLLPTWRAALERVVQFAVADIDLLALGSSAPAAVHTAVPTSQRLASGASGAASGSR